MRLSVIIPTLNEAEYIEPCLNSVYREFSGEVLVIDGGSQDGTRARAMSAGARVWQQDRGLASQCNFGAGEAMGDTLCFLSADCQMVSGWYEQLNRCLSSPYVVGGGYRLQLDGEGFGYRVITFGGNFRSLFCKIALADQALFVRKAAFFEAGGMSGGSLIPHARLSFALGEIGEFKLLDHPVRSSTRKWDRAGKLRTTLGHVRTYLDFRRELAIPFAVR